MKAQAGRSRAKQATRKPPPTAPLTRSIIVDALRTWVVPAVTITVSLAVFVADNIGLVDDGPAVIIVGALTLILVLFFGLRSFTATTPSGQLAAIMIAFAVLWSTASFYPFYRAINPGTPLFTTELHRNGAPTTVPLHARPGHYSVVVEGHFLPTEAKENRTATYRITIAHGGVTDHFIEGAFSQEWRRQRVGSGRRSSMVPVMSQTTQKRDTLDDADGHDITMQLTDLSPGVRDSVTLRVYTERIPQWMIIALGVVTFAGALLIDALRDKGTSEGLMTTLTLATFAGIVVFRSSTASTPGFPQLVIAALVGTLIAAIAGPLLWRLIRPVRRYLPAFD